MGYNHTYLFMVYGHFHTTMTELSRSDRIWPAQPKILIFCPLQRKCANPFIRHRQSFEFFKHHDSIYSLIFYKSSAWIVINYQCASTTALFRMLLDKLFSLARTVSLAKEEVSNAPKQQWRSHRSMTSHVSFIWSLRIGVKANTQRSREAYDMSVCNFSCRIWF